MIKSFVAAGHGTASLIITPSPGLEWRLMALYASLDTSGDVADRLLVIQAIKGGQTYWSARAHLYQTAGLSRVYSCFNGAAAHIDPTSFEITVPIPHSWVEEDTMLYSTVIDGAAADVLSLRATLEFRDL